MIVWDGSRHDCLVTAIDDATGEVLQGAHLVDQECTVGSR